VYSVNFLFTASGDRGYSINFFSRPPETAGVFYNPFFTASGDTRYVLNNGLRILWEYLEGLSLDNVRTF
jgi:hypothetical protein